MALTQEQWYDKLSTFLPNWFFTDDEDGVQVATLQSIALLLSEMETDVDFFLDQTFIEEADDEMLDLHGDERGVTRFTGEIDHPAYSDRIRSMRSSLAYANLFAQVKAVLNNGDPIILENMSHAHMDDDLFLDDNDATHMDKRKIYNRLIVLIPVQTGGDEEQIKLNIIEAIEQNKAAGVGYDVMYGWVVA